MKKTCFTLLAIFAAGLMYAQTTTRKPALSSKILLSNGQKIVVNTIVSVESSLSPGMDVTNNTTSENVLEVKNTTDKNYTISNTLTKLKVNVDMMGQNTSYDSDKKEDQGTDIGKSFADKLNKPSDVIIDNATGIAAAVKKPEEKKDIDEGNPMQGLLQMFGDNGDDAIVSGAFQLIPPGKNVGDTWYDTSTEAKLKILRSYTLKAITDSGAVIQLNATMEGANTVEIQGMQMEVNTSTQTISDLVFDVATGQVRKKTTRATVSGSFQVMGQSVPISAKANTVSTYK